MKIKEAVEKYKLDKRRNWFVFMGTVVFDDKYTMPCNECHGDGCEECGFHGKKRDSFPCPAIHNGNPIKVTDKEFTHYKNFKRKSTNL